MQSILAACVRPARVALSATCPVAQMVATQTRGVKMQYMRKGMKQKSAAKKRFRITGKGNIKYFPSNLHGGKKMVYKLGITGLEKHLAAVFPGKGYKKTVNNSMKSRYLETEAELDDFMRRAPKH